MIGRSLLFFTTLSRAHFRPTEREEGRDTSGLRRRPIREGKRKARALFSVAGGSGSRRKKEEECERVHATEEGNPRMR